MSKAQIALILALSTPVALAQDVAHPSKPIESSITMPSGRHLTLPGSWTETKTLGGEHALVFTRWLGGHRQLVSLDAGESEPRVIAAIGAHEGSLFRSLAWAPDGSACYAWLDVDSQLCRIDARTGEIQSLTSIPSHRATWCSASTHCDPTPVPRDAGVVATNDMLLLVMRAEPNASTPADPANGRKYGSSWLAALDPTDGSMVELSNARWPSRNHDSWDISISRKTLYRTTNTDDRIVATAFDGTPLWDAPLSWELAPVRPVDCLSLSPDGRTLLIEREDRELSSYPTGGCAFMDLNDHSMREGLSHGHAFDWSPDSTRIAYLHNRSLRIYDIAGASAETVATLHAAFDWPPPWTRPRWSPNGRMLFTNIGEENDVHQVFDLSAHTVLVLDCGFESGNVGFAPMARPFGGK